MIIIQAIFGILISYFIGSCPIAYLFGKFYKGIDIRQHGSGNMGATNAFRVLGKIPGTIVLILEEKIDEKKELPGLLSPISD